MLDLYSFKASVYEKGVSIHYSTLVAHYSFSNGVLHVKCISIAVLNHP